MMELQILARYARLPGVVNHLASIIHEGCRSTPLASGTGRIDGGVVRALLNALWLGNLGMSG
ncbi:MAG: hypothetical protein ACLPWS_20315, partial [Rhodomicrobium sp.]